MAIRERVDLVGNVSAQARKWARDLAKLSAQAKAFNRAMGGGGSSSRGQDKVAAAQARAERAKAAAIRAQARATAQAAREQAKLAKAQFGPTRRDAHGAMMRRQREQAQAAKASARAQAAAAREQTRAANAQARAQAKAPMFGPGRREATASAMQRQKAAAQAAKQAAKAEAQAAKLKTKAANDNAKALSRQEAAQARAAAKQQAASRKNDYRYTLKRTETGGIGGAINSMAGNFAAGAAMQAVGVLTDLMRSMASTFVQAQVFREQSIAGLTILTKSGTEAKKIWQESFDLARQTGTSQQAAMSSIQTMMAQGFKKGDAVELYKLMNAISVINPQANLEGIVRAISQIKNTGKLQGDELLQLADAGVSVDAVYKALGKRLGKTREQIIAMQGAGEIKADDAIAAIKEAMTDSVGGAGNVDKVLAGKANSLGAILSRLQAAPMTFFSGLEANPALMEKMKTSLSGLVDLLDPTTAKGQKAAESFSKLIDAIAGPGADLFAKLADGAPEFLEATTKLAADLGPIVSLIGLGASQVMWLASGINTLVEKLRSIDFSPLWGFLPSIISWIGEVTGLFSSGGSSMASALVSGLTNGIFGGQSSIVSAITSMAASAIGAGNAAFAIKSPSRVFAAMGEMLPAGLARGVNDNMAVVERSSQAMAGAAVGSAGGALPFVGRAYADAGAGAVNKTISMGGVRQQNVFNLGSERDSAAAEIGAIQRRVIQQEIQAFFGKQAEAA